MSAKISWHDISKFKLAWMKICCLNTYTLWMLNMVYLIKYLIHLSNNCYKYYNRSTYVQQLFFKNVLLHFVYFYLNIFLTDILFGELALKYKMPIHLCSRISYNFHDCLMSLSGTQVELIYYWKDLRWVIIRFPSIQFFLAHKTLNIVRFFIITTVIKTSICHLQKREKKKLKLGKYDMS